MIKGTALSLIRDMSERIYKAAHEYEILMHKSKDIQDTFRYQYIISIIEDTVKLKYYLELEKRYYEQEEKNDK